MHCKITSGTALLRHHNGIFYPTMSRSDRWCFTLNNPTNELNDLLWLQPTENGILYACVGREVAPTTGTTHWQGYLRFDVRKRLAQLQRIIPGAHYEVARGTEQENRVYCTKDGAFVEFGQFNADAGKKGRRTDLEDIATKIASGSGAMEIAEAHPSDYIRYHSGIDRLISLSRFRNSQTHRTVSIMVLFGPTRIGKTYFVYHVVAPSLTGGMYKTPSPSLRGGYSPFDMYNGEELLFIDEFDFHNWPITLLNEVLEGYPQQLQCRYNNKFAMWTSIVICTNIDPTTWYLAEPTTLVDAMKARLRGCVHHVEDRAQLESIEKLPAAMW